MKAAVCYEAGKPLVIEEVDLDPPRKDEVKVRMAVTAICHTDIYVIRGDSVGHGDPPGVPRFPNVAGHESSGFIEEVGEDVTSVKPGDPVVLSLLRSCGRCFYCTTGAPYRCEAKWPLDMESPLRNKRGERIIYGVIAGSFAEYSIAHHSQVVPIPKDMPMDSASLLGCGFITGFGAVVNTAQVQPLSSVVVVGLGGVGLSAVQGAVLAGAHPIIGVDVLDNKLEAARTFGATHTFNSAKEDAIKAVRGLTSDRGADYAFVTAGSAAAFTVALSLTRRGGQTVVVGVPHGKDTLILEPRRLTSSRIIGCTMGSTRLSEDIPRLVAAYKAGRIKLDELISRRYPLEQINEAIESFEKGEALRNVIVF